ncbi:prephenate dehydrogenase [Candidatus Acidulodesulfobacterium sp. H_13]|uniref:prephenate dehydrogenase n=1 Tax=Candidatus Acidulodesulfobacterium sp. H_13 TaxID=3395470 RepID=UPI003AF635BA
MFNEISIIGLGFMGASIAGAVKAKNSKIRITGYDIAQNNIRYCKSCGLIDDVLNLESDICDCRGDNLIIMCAPPSAIVSLIDAYKAFFRDAQVVTDIGSIKDAITTNARIKNIENFVGSHPMCGSDKSGPENADFKLFNGKNCIVMREDFDLTDKDRADKIEKTAEFWRMIGMNVIYSTADSHDNIAAYTSHLPHLISFLLSGAVLNFILREKGREKEKGVEVLDFIGNGFKDSTRIASSSPELWTDIFLMNSENILASLEDFMVSANILKGLIETGDREGLSTRIREIAERREEVGF